LQLTSEQANQLGVGKGSQLSPYLEMCCLRISANVSYAHATEDVALLTGVRVSPKTQQRLVQRQSFAQPTVQQSDTVNQVSLDGGQMRFVTPKGEASEWKQYKAVRLDIDGMVSGQRGISQLGQRATDTIPLVLHRRWPCRHLESCCSTGRGEASG